MIFFFYSYYSFFFFFFFFQAEDGIRDRDVTGVQTCALPICPERTTRGVARLPEHTVWYHPPAVILRRDSNPSHSTLESFPCEGEHTMSELVTKSVAQEQPGQKIETRTAAQRVAGFHVVVTAGAVLAVLVATACYAQDKYSLKSPSGIAFSDFKGYERSEEHTSELQSHH